jgi:hypothetical protein
MTTAEASLSDVVRPSNRWLTVAQAAAYAGTSPEEFLNEVAEGTWPAAGRETAASGPLWDRKALDAASDRLSGLDPATQAALANATAHLLTIEQAAMVLRCSVDTVYRVSPDDLPVCRPGKVNLYRTEDVLRYATSKTRARRGIAHAQIEAALRSVRSAA